MSGMAAICRGGTMSSLAIFGRPACFPCTTRAAAAIRARQCSSTSVKRSASGDLPPGHGSLRRPSRADRTRLPDQPARTRFAPSPTGYLHLGSLRTALYNYLLARATNGQFVLRLEDTDQSRLVPDAEERLYKDLMWSGLAWDEGPDRGGPFGPYKQSERLPIYKQYANRLVDQGKAFRCFCSQEDLASHQKKALETEGTFGTYPGMCLSVPDEEAADRAARGEVHTIRFRSSPEPVPIEDVVYGTYRKRVPEDHFIIMKSDGYPTYHFANVVDDHLMKITHVVRGAEWLISTAKHVSLYNAFQWEPPKFAHIGLLVDTNRQKLSKRNMDIGIDSYQRDAVPPPALLNFAALLGWNPGSSTKKGVMTLEEMINGFNLKFTKGDIIVNKEKLAFFHKKHMRLALDDPSPDNALVREYLVLPILKAVTATELARTAAASSPSQTQPNPDVRDDLDLSSLGDSLLGLSPDDASTDTEPHARIRAMLRISRSEAVTAPELISANKYLLWRPSNDFIRQSYPKLAGALHSIFVDDEPRTADQVFDVIIDRLDKIGPQSWVTEELHEVLESTAKRITDREEGKPPSSVGYKFLRWALLGMSPGPQMTPLIRYLGKTETMRRLRLAQLSSASL